VPANSQNNEKKEPVSNAANIDHKYMRMKKKEGILLPMNFSDQCQKALNFAVALSELVHQGITLLHVYDIHLSERRLGKEKVAEEIKVYEQKLMARMGDFMRYLPKNTIDFQPIYQRGNQVNETISLLKNSNFDWMIVGMTQNKRLKDYLFGNNLEEIINSTKTSTIAIPEEAKFNGIKKIVYVTNFIDDNILALQELDDFARLFNASITILHIDNHVTTNDEKVVARYKKAMARMLTASFEVTVIESKEIAISIENYIQEKGADLLTILKKDRSFTEKMFHSSLTERLLSTTNIPMLILREESTGGN